MIESRQVQRVPVSSSSIVEVEVEIEGGREKWREIW